MRIVLFYAMAKEIESLLTDAEKQKLETIAGVDFFRIRDDVVACFGGIGKVNAAMAAQIAIMRYQPDLIINVGVAGCLKEAPIGTILLAQAFIQHDVDTTGCGDPVGLVSTVNRVDFPVSYFERAQKALASMHVPFLSGIGATGDWFAKRGERAHWICETFSPLFVEMEGGAVAQVCFRNQTPFLAIKSVSDCVFGNDDYDFNFACAMKSLNGVVLSFIDAFLEIS